MNLPKLPAMSITKITLALFLVAWIGFSCEKETPEPIVPAKKPLQLNLVEAFTTAPAKVSVFFRVEDEDGNPVADLTEADFTIFEKSMNDELEVEITADDGVRQISPKGAVFSSNTLLVLDLSGSVVNNSLNALKDAAKQFINKVIPAEADTGIKMGIKWFDGEDVLHELIGLTPDRSELIDAIDFIFPNISSDNSTDFYGAVLKSVEEAQTILASDTNVTAATSVVYFTDGKDQAARYSKSNAISAVNSADANIAFYTIGLGDDIDQTVLQDIGKNDAVFAESTGELNESFSSIGQAVFDQSNSYYLFEYCSPKRNGNTDLRIEAARDNEEGSINTTFDATGFSGGCTL